VAGIKMTYGFSYPLLGMFLIETKTNKEIRMKNMCKKKKVRRKEREKEKDIYKEDRTV
jgi:hypothetical protein